MSGKIKAYLATTAEHSKTAEALRLPCVYLIYRVGENGALQRQAASCTGQNGLMGLIDSPWLTRCDPAKLVREISLECSRRSMRGVVIDIEPDGANSATVAALAAHLAAKSMECYIPVALATPGTPAKIIVPSALSGGSFDEMLDSYASRYGAENLCLEIVRTCNEFTMPAYSPEGQTLSAAQLRDIMAQSDPSIYFSPDMLCKYFTYRTGDGTTRFVLFDDQHTAGAKLDRAQARGLHSAVLLYSEWGASARDILMG